MGIPLEFLLELGLRSLRETQVKQRHAQFGVKSSLGSVQL